MARELTVTYEHAVYDTYNYQGGADLSVDPGDLTKLLMAADGSDRRPGYFFETLNDQFVFGFERMREDAHGKSREMAYFDLFVTPVENVEEIPLTAIRDSLKMERVADYERTPESEVTIKYTLNDGSDQDGGFTQDRVDSVLIAEIWEQYRSRSDQPQLLLDDLERFVDAVDGMLPELSYVSRWADREVVETNYFDAVEGPQEHDDVVAEDLLQTVKDLQKEGQLSYDTLPGYEAVLERQKEQKQSAVVNDGLSDEISQVFERGAKRTRSRINDFPSKAPELIDDALMDDLVEETNDENADEVPWTYYGVAALCGLVVSIVSAVASAPLGGMVGQPASTGWIAINGFSVFLVGLLIADISRYEYGFDTKKEQKRAGLAWGALVVGTLAVGLAIVSGANAFVGPDLAIELPVVTFDVANFLGTLVGLLIGGTAMVALGQQFREFDRRARRELSLLDRHAVNGLDEDALITIDERLQEETESVNEWIEEQLVPKLQTELQQKVETNAKRSAEQTVESIEDLRGTEAYKQVHSSDGSD